MPVSQRPSQNRAAHVLIDRAAFAHNLQRVREFAPHSKVMAVIKADGYGHGMEVAAEALQGADEFAVNSLDDVQRLRTHGIDKPLTLLSAQLSVDELNQLPALNTKTVFYDASQLAIFKQLRPDAELSLWLKVDTGMGRLGISPSEVAYYYAQLSALSGIHSISLMTHLANADDAQHPSNATQIEAINTIAQAHDFAELSIVNSAGVIHFGHCTQKGELNPQSAVADRVRPGMMLYGVSPIASLSAYDLGLRPVMTFKSQLISVKNVTAGSSIGYGGTYTVDADSRIGVVACGYGDGYPRHAPNGTPVLVNEVLVPLIGRVSMDMLVVDLTGVTAHVGDEVTLWGADNPIEEVAALAGTISYELTCGVLPRVERIII